MLHRSYTEGVLVTKDHALDVIDAMKETLLEIASMTGFDDTTPILSTQDVLMLLVRLEKEIQDNAMVNTLMRDVELRGDDAYEGTC